MNVQDSAAPPCAPTERVQPSPASGEPFQETAADGYRLGGFIWRHGVPDPTTVDPDAWEHDLALLARAGQDDVQLALFRDYTTNRDLYPAVHAWLRTSNVPVLAIWGRNDEIFDAAGARAFTRDTPNARVELIDGGHFLLESDLDLVSAMIKSWLG